MAETTDLLAVVGMACRYPGITSPDQLWANVRDGVESVSTFSAEELAAAGVPADRIADPDYVRAKGALDNVDLFDAEFFGFTPREVEIMDPQHRLFLECCWEAFEHAGHDPRAFTAGGGRVGVYAGSGFNSYLVAQLLSRPDLLAAAGIQARLLNDKDFLTTHVSYKLDLRGPSLGVQTACSTSLVATHLACQSLLEGECDMALAGGVTISFPHRVGYLYTEGGILARDGHCRAFDEAAQGTVESNGAGVVLLRRLADALDDGDTVHAVIRGSAINNDGAAKAGYTAPSVESQTRVIAEALALAQVRPDTIGYVEAHGSGTPIGDPIEVEALNRAFRKAGDRRQNAAGLGSVKTNFGHPDSAAGAASLIKTVQALKHRQIPPTLHFQKPNPRLRLDEGPFYIAAELRDWPAGPEPRRAGVNSLGIGGTNAHVVLEEAPEEEPAGPSRPWQVLLLSARSATALDAATANLRQHLEEHPETDIADAAHTLRVGRRAFRHRRAVVCRDREDALAALADPARSLAGAVPGSPDDTRRVAYLLPGIGEHYPGMAAGLYLHEPAFREALDRCAEILLPELGLDLREVIYPGGPKEEAGDAAAKPDLRRLLAAPEAGETEESRRLHRTALAHPAVFALEYALAQVWKEWGIAPRGGMLGYSLGEYVAACLAGVFSLEDALKLVALRARLIDELPAGAMLAVPLPAADVEALLAGLPTLGLAAANGPALSIVAGPPEDVDALARQLAGRSVACRRLPTTHAFHTAAMEPVVPALENALAGMKLAAPKSPFVSNVTGAWVTAEEATDPAYWARHLTRTVRFAEGLATLMEGRGGEAPVLLEVGPGQTLGTLARQHPRRPENLAAVASLRDGRERTADVAVLLGALGRLWLAGAAPDWRGFASREKRRRVPLPTYPFERRRYFVDVAPEQAAEPGALAGNTGRQPLDDWLSAPVWERSPERAPVALEPGERWLLLTADETAEAGLGERLAARLEAQGAKVVRAVPGPGLARLWERLYSVDPESREDFAALFQAMEQEEGGLPSRIVHLWTAGEEGESLPFYSLLALAQALGEIAPERRGTVHLTVASSGLFEVIGGEALHPARATVLGPCRVLPQEMPGVASGAIDVVLPPAPTGLDRLAAELAAELSHPREAGETAVALRGRHRWVRRFRPVRLPAVPAGMVPARLRHGGCYLVTGAQAEAGLAVAEHLFRKAGARLALLAAADAPARERWTEWLNIHDEEDETSRRIRRYLALEASGCELLFLPVDLAAPERASAAVERVRERFGEVHGVVHAAPVTGAGLLQWKSREQAAAVLEPAVRGTLALDAATRAFPLDFFVVFGSNTAVTGGLGQGDTAAAAAFLDAFAQARAQEQGPFTVALDWGFFRWQPIETADPALAAKLREALAAYGIGAAEMAEILDRALAGPLPQVVVSTQDLSRVMAQLDASTAASLAADLASSRASEVHPRPDLQVPYAEPEGEVEEAIAGVWREAFGLEQVGRHDDFFDLSGSSLLAIQIVTRLSSILAVDLPMASLLESPTVAALAQRVERLRRPAAAAADPGAMDRLLREIESLSPEEAEARLARFLATRPPASEEVSAP